MPEIQTLAVDRACYVDLHFVHADCVLFAAVEQARRSLAAAQKPVNTPRRRIERGSVEAPAGVGFSATHSEL
jgi:hypothetical protein